LLVTRGDTLDIRSEVKYVFVEGKLVELAIRKVQITPKRQSGDGFAGETVPR
jgi:hypothetical protein